SLLTAYALARRPFSFLTDGQSVPECIRVAEAEHLSDLILGDA
ncbi:MAG: flagellar biosynthesis protein FlhF, partial [Firmicutes bacterium]|nr:flagellar biosynthesis protein FlhF [Bacillota bacterium]